MVENLLSSNIKESNVTKHRPDEKPIKFIIVFLQACYIGYLVCILFTYVFVMEGQTLYAIFDQYPIVDLKFSL